MKLDEQKLIKTVGPYFENSRAGDWGHASRVVRWVKELGQGRDDLDTLITAAYIHDIGWSGIAPKGKIYFNEMLKLENMANDNTSRLVNQVLVRLNFNQEEIDNVIRLIKAADNHESVKDDEAIIVDVDYLSKLCLEHLQEKYESNSYLDVVKTWVDELPRNIKTTKAKGIYPGLFDQLKQDLRIK